MRTPFLAANWKMFKTVSEAVVYAKEFRSLVKDVGDVEIVLAPPFTALHAVAEACRNTNVGVAGQNMSWEKEGAFTGEISGGMLKEAGAEYVIIGHSERRRLFGETDEIVNRKSIAAFHANLVPIVCIGETLEEREGEQTLPVLDRQLKDGLDGLTADSGGGAGHRIRAGMGHRHRAGTRRRSRPTKRTRTSGAGCVSGSGRTRRSGVT